MNNNQIAAIIIALINSRYICPGKDNEKTAKEIVDVYHVLRDKTYGDEDESEVLSIPEQLEGKLI